MPDPSRPDRGALNLAWADALMAGLFQGGVRHAVISPGARSTPLVLACDRHPGIRIWDILDERSAAFFALGLSLARDAPVLLIATSGSAPAHWHPAVIEADHGRLPLILLSADRPPEALGWGANQTTDQRRLFGPHLRAFFDPGTPRRGSRALAFMRALGVRATADACWPKPGPVQIDLPFRKPLTAAHAPPWTPPPAMAATGRPSLLPDPEQVQRVASRLSGRPGLLICGPGRFEPGFAGKITRLARRLGAPLLADPLSGLRFGPHPRETVITRYDAFLRAPAWRGGDPCSPQWVLRFGAVPVSRTLSDYLERAAAPLCLCDPVGDWPDPSFATREWITADPERFCRVLDDQALRPAPATWLARFRHQERAAAPTGDLPVEAELIRLLIDALPARGVLFSGNSLPIRQLDTWSGSGETPIRILCNRGVSGIDGNISTLLGLAAAGERVVGLIGDLALCHDMNGLLAAPGLDAVIVVLNNGGGAIFGHLPQSGLEGFERHWLMPQGLDLRQLARLHHLDFHRTFGSEDFVPALERALATPGVSLVEVVIDRERSLAAHRRYWQRFGGG